jgi:hypothetical protein
MNVLSKIRYQFISELSEINDHWRILRTNPLVDQIILSYTKFTRSGDTDHLISIVNFALKIKIATWLERLQPSNNSQELFEQLGKSNERIILLYDQFLNLALSQKFCQESDQNRNIDGEVQYLKMVNEIGLKEYSDEVFDKIICIAIKLLQEREN